MMFSNKQLITLLLPIMVEQLLNSFMGMADTMMVSNVGSAAISAVSLVDSINVLVIQVFTALGAGAAIICSQYLGRGDRESSNEAARQVTLSVLTISTVLSIFCIIFTKLSATLDIRSLNILSLLHDSHSLSLPILESTSPIS